MKYNRFWWCLLGLTLAVRLNAAEADALAAVPIVESGLPSAAIVVGEGCTDLEQRAARLLQKKIAERTGCELPLKNASDANAEATKDARIAIVICPAKQPATKGEADRNPNGFTIASSEQAGVWRVEIRGDDPLGTLFGVGRLLREMDYAGGGALLRMPIEIAETPAFPIRGVFCANHLQDTGYKYWSLADWRSYLEELALEGANTVFFLPLQFGQALGINQAVGAASDPPRKDFWATGDNVFTDGTDAERADWWSLRNGVIQIAHELGMKAGIYVGANDVFASQFAAHPEIQIDYKVWPTEQAHVCPSTPLGRQLILEDREELFRRLLDLDYVWVPSADYGGCGCAKCYPWYITYANLCREIAERLHKYHPKAKFCISNQGSMAMPAEVNEAQLKRLADDYGFQPGHETEWLRAQLVEDRLPWLDAIMYANYSPDDIADVATKLPRRMELLDMQLDITVTAGWGSSAANPIPNAITQHLAKRRNVRRGLICYSEGIHDDLNKFVWIRLLWNPDQSADAVVGEYCRYYFGEATVKYVVSAIDQLEARQPAEYLGQLRPSPKATPSQWDKTDETARLIEEGAARMTEQQRNGWRWKMLVLRVRLDQLKALVASEGKPVKLAMEGPPLTAVQAMAIVGRSASLSDAEKKEQDAKIEKLQRQCRRLAAELWTQVRWRPANEELGMGFLVPDMR